MLLGVMGHAGSGKDTVADYLVAKHNYAKVALADPLKRICKEVFDFTDEQLWGPSEERNKPDSRYKGLTPRKALQLLGTEWGRAVYEDVWIDKGLRTAKSILEGRLVYSATRGLRVGGDWDPERYKSGVVIPDTRFQNEVDKVRAADGKVIKIIRPQFDGSQAMAVGIGVTGHASETEMDKVTGVDVVLFNNATVADLHKQLDAVLESWNVGG